MLTKGKLLCEAAKGIKAVGSVKRLVSILWFHSTSPFGHRFLKQGLTFCAVGVKIIGEYRAIVGLDAITWRRKTAEE